MKHLHKMKENRTNMEGWERREWKMPNTVLIPLIENLKRRTNELCVIYDFEWDDNNSGKGYEKADDIRIVFWFDN